MVWERPSPNTYEEGVRIINNYFYNNYEGIRAFTSCYIAFNVIRFNNVGI